MADLIEPIAKIIYEAMRFERTAETPEWVERGNSTAQSEARRAAHAIASLPAQGVRVKPLWHPIETAPRGGEWFIARTERGTTRVVHFADEYDRFPISHDGVTWPTAPTEWTPLAPVLAALEPAEAGGVEPCADYPNCPPNQTCDRCAGRAPVDALVKAATSFRDAALRLQDNWKDGDGWEKVSAFVATYAEDEDAWINRALAAIREGRT